MALFFPDTTNCFTIYNFYIVCRQSYIQEHFYKKAISAFACLSLIGCATSPNKISSSYVSPIQYSDYSCKQIALEMTNISRRVSELYGQLDKEASNDTAQMAVGLVLFWPALFFLEGGDGPQAAEYARLKGEREALETVAVQKNCDPAMMPKFVEPKPPEPTKPKKQHSD